jgi:hypothetical protein
MREAWEREIRDEQDMSGVGEQKKRKQRKIEKTWWEGERKK